MAALRCSLRYRALSLVRHRGGHDDRVLQQIGKAVDATRIFRKSAAVLIVRIIEPYRGHAKWMQLLTVLNPIHHLATLRAVPD